MPPPDPQPLEYQVPELGDAPRMRPWVVVAGLYFVGALAGRMLWSVLGNPRMKSPDLLLGWANAAGFGLLVVLCLVFRKRLTRFRLFDLLAAFALGVLSSAAAVGWYVLRY